jgi:1,2-diacylglycerol 3-beta-glucosyltransferase
VILLLIFLLVSFFYAAIAVYLAGGIHGRYAKRQDLPSISIIIPVRNEELRLPSLLNSLITLDYPPELVQIIIVNDQSEDRTRDVALSYAARFRCRCEVHDVVDEEDGKLILKTRPLAQGLDRATGEIALMVDADCVVPPEWAKGIVAHYVADVGMVCGTTLPNPDAETRPLLTRFETLDWLFLLGSALGLAGRGYPQALIGNNYSVRMSAYRDVGTFRSLHYTDLDDIALIRAVQESKTWRVVFPAACEARAFTRPQQSFVELVRQRRRWIKGGSHADVHVRFILGFGSVMHISLPLWPFFLGWGCLVPFAGLLIGDLFVLWRMLKTYRRQDLLWLAPWYPFFPCAYGIGLSLLSLFGRKVKWKNRTF